MRILSFFILSCFFQLLHAQQQHKLSASSVASSSKADMAQINALNNTAAKFLDIDLDSARVLAERAKSLSIANKYPFGQAEAMLNLTAIYQNMGSFIIATQNGLEALSLYEKLHDETKQASVCLALAMVYKDMGRNASTATYTNTAIDYSRMGRRFYGQLTDTAGIVNSLSLEGTLNRDKGMHKDSSYYYNIAFEAFSKAIRLAKTSGKGVQYLSKLYNNISQVYSEQKHDYRMALTYLLEAVKLNEQKKSFISLSFNYGNISEVYLNLGKKDSGLFYARKTMEIARQTNRPNRLSNASFQLSNAYKAIGKYDSALFYFKYASRLNDSLMSIAKTQQVTELQTRYETGQKESQILLLNAENSVKSNRITLLISGLILFAILAVGLVMLYQRVQKQKIQLSAQAERLETMMKELHHRVKNNLQIVSSLLNMQLYKLHDEDSISALKTSSERVQAMSLIHQRLYKKDELTSVNLNEYIYDLCESLMQSYGYTKEQLDLQVNVQQSLINVDLALPIGLIVNELITNALKYAYSKVAHPSLYVTLTSAAAEICLSVKDNGSSFDEQQWLKQKGSFGKQIITSLCRQLRAKQTVHTSNGTEFVITIPQKAA